VPSTPAVLLPAPSQHFTGLRTLLTSGNRLGYNGEDMLEEEASPQGVPLALSALSQLEELRLDCNRDLDQLPQASCHSALYCPGCRLPVLVMWPMNSAFVTQVPLTTPLRLRSCVRNYAPPARCRLSRV
jgi:hypothetical protein